MCRGGGFEGTPKSVVSISFLFCVFCVPVGGVIPSCSRRFCGQGHANIVSAARFYATPTPDVASSLVITAARDGFAMLWDLTNARSRSDVVGARGTIRRDGSPYYHDKRVPAIGPSRAFYVSDMPCLGPNIVRCSAALFAGS